MGPFVAIIMAGGKGQRFWPLSTADKPKQFLDLEHTGRTLLQSTFDRVLPLVEGEAHVFVATAERYAALVRSQLPTLPAHNLIIEPEGRDSAPAVALASLTVARRIAGATLGFFSADHRITGVPTFHARVQGAAQLAEETGGLVALGITPTHPATGYGYIQAGERAGEHGFRVARFVEKPNQRQAQRLLELGGHYWNAGIFVWTTEAILSEFRRHAPNIIGPLERAFAEGRVDEVFPTLEKISIDYAVMERTDKAYVVPGDFDWDDIGDWVALERLLNRSEANTVVGKHVGLETSGNIIYTENPEDTIVTLGVENLVIVKRGNTLLLVRKDRVQDIKKLLADERLAELVLD